jgi:hypothetical protein
MNVSTDNVHVYMMSEGLFCILYSSLPKHI